MVKRLFEDEDDCHDVTVEEAIKKLEDGIHLSYKDTVELLLQALQRIL